MRFKTTRAGLAGLVAGCLFTCATGLAADPEPATALCGRKHGPATHRPGPRRRRRERRCPRRRAEGARGNARAGGLHRRHQHGRAGRRGLRVRHPGRRTAGIPGRHRLEVGRRRPRPARPAADRAEARRRDLQQQFRAGTEGQARRRPRRHRQHQRHRGPAAHLRGPRPHAVELRPAADPVPCRRHRHDHRRDGGARQGRPRDGDAREHGDPRRVRAGGHRRLHPCGRRHGAQHPGGRGARAVRGRRHRGQPRRAGRAAREAAVGDATAEPQHGRDDRRPTRRCSCER